MVNIQMKSIVPVKAFLIMGVLLLAFFLTGSSSAYWLSISVSMLISIIVLSVYHLIFVIYLSRQDARDLKVRLQKIDEYYASQEQQHKMYLGLKKLPIIAVVTQVIMATLFVLSLEAYGDWHVADLIMSVFAGVLLGGTVVYFFVQIFVYPYIQSKLSLPRPTRHL